VLLFAFVFAFWFGFGFAGAVLAMMTGSEYSNNMVFGILRLAKMV